MQNVLLVKEQIQKVIDKVIEKKKKREHEYLDSLQRRLQSLLKSMDTKNFNEVRKRSEINGALRAYFDSDLVESYEEPLVVELDKLEMMLK